MSDLKLLETVDTIDIFVELVSGIMREIMGNEIGNTINNVTINSSELDNLIISDLIKFVNTNKKV